MSARRRGSSTRAPCGGGRQEEAGLKRGPWTPEEDELLSRFVAREGEGRWRTLPRRAGLLRCGKSCRLRWMNYLRPSIKRGPIAADEEDLILRLHRLLGNRWSLIAGRLPGRTDNEIKNYWNTHLSKKLIAQGIDPRTHKPLADQSRDTCSKAKAPAPPLELVVVPAVLHPVSSVVDAGAGGDDHHLDGLGSFPWMMSLDGSDMWCGDVVGPQGLDDQLGGSSTKAAGGGRSDDGVGCSTVDDDGLSSFLDSLINDDCYILADNEVAADRSSGRDAALP